MQRLMKWLLLGSAVAIGTAGTADAGGGPCACVGDTNSDGVVGAPDLAALLGSWGPCSGACANCAADFNGDCIVNNIDLGILLGAWGSCPVAADPGPSLPQAIDLGPLEPVDLNACQFVGPGDVDVYRFTVTQASAVSGSITNRSAGIEAWLIADVDNNGVWDGGESLEAAGSPGPENLAFGDDLVPGTYYVWLSPWSPLTGYSLSLEGTPIPALAVDPGDTMPTAHNLGTVGASAIHVSDLLGGHDQYDVYRFSVTQGRSVNLAVTGRTEGIQYWLIADTDGDGVFSGGEDLEYAGSSGANDLSVGEDLAPGTYFVWFAGWSEESATRYTLTMTSSLLNVTTSQDPGDSLPESYELGVSGGGTIEVSDIIGGYDVNDVFHFSVTQPRVATITVTGRNEGAQVWLVADANGDGIAGGDEVLEYAGAGGSSDLAVGEDLVPGDYFVWVSVWSPSDSTRYTLRVTSAPITVTTTSDPGSTIPQSYDLGVSGAAMIEVKDLVGGYDATDAYRFTMTQARAATITLTGRTEGCQLWLVADRDGDGVFSGGEELEYAGTGGAEDLSFGEDLGVGTYYLFVVPWGSSDSSRYTLRVTSTALTITTSSDPGTTFAGAYALGTINAGPGVTHQEIVGGYDAADVFKFTAGSAGTFTATVTGRTEGGQVWLARDLNGNGAFEGNEIIDYDGNGGSGNLAVSASLLSGVTYFVWIEPWGNDNSTRYTVAVFKP
jgi:hypothetical protein